MQVRTRGLLLGDVATGGVILDELLVTMTFPSGQPVLPRLDLETLRTAHFQIDHLLVKISRDWINKALAQVPQLASKGLAVQLSMSDTESAKITFSGSFKRHVSFSLDFHLGIQGNLLHILIDEIRVLKFLPLFSLPGLKGLILNTIKENLPPAGVRMNQQEIFVDVVSQSPLPVTLRWRRFQTEGAFVVVEAGT
ncbi:MAG TPA: hypothetical protein VGO93_24595 [Candidatus Xenobia bacterium]|jgi:hypothetical protein